MAEKRKSGWEQRAQRNAGSKTKVRVLTAASTEIDVGDKVQAQRQRMLRQNWQLQAWTLFNSIPELSYAEGFLSHCVGRMRVFPAAYPVTGETDHPLPINDALLNAPSEVIEACTNAMNDLGNGRLAIKTILEALSLNLSVTGEAFLLGIVDDETEQQVWSIRSVSEVVIYDDQIKLREGPMTNTGVLGLIDLPPDTMVERMWQPHPQFRLLAQSPMRALVQTCEDLMILRRIIRATGRSRLAGRGILFLPSEMDVPILNDDNGAVDGDDFLSKLTTSMMTPIRNEGDASGVVPLVVQMPGEQIDKVKWIEFASTFDEQAGNIRTELIGVIASGLDIPKEVVIGMTDLNHWSAWQVDSNTFRHHIEPHVISEMECLTGAFLRPYFATCGLEPEMVNEWLQRIVFWYDPTELVTPPDLSASAVIAYNARVISGAALRRYLGFKDSDAPTAEELELRLVSDTRTWPANVLMALLHELDPTLAIPAVAGPPALPGIDPVRGVISAPIPSNEPDTTTSPTIVDVPSTNGMPENPNSLTASGLIGIDRAMMIRVITDELARRGEIVGSPVVPRVDPRDTRLSRRLVAIDADLRSKLQVAANAEMKGQLYKAGHRTRQSVAKNKELRDKIATTKNEFVMLRLSGDIDPVVASSYITNDWGSLEQQFKAHTRSAQLAAIAVAAELGKISKDEAYAASSAVMNDNVERAWTLLKDSMDSLAQHLAYSPDPNITDEQSIEALNPDTLVPAGVIRSVIAVAGGASLGSLQTIQLSNGADVPLLLTPGVGGIGTGPTIADALSDAGVVNTNYEWVHGPVDRPFDPHLELDGVEFATFSDDVLANTGDFPPGPFFFPGDHDGCRCDAMPQWVSPADES